MATTTRKPGSGKPTLRIVRPDDAANDPLFADYGPVAEVPKSRALRPLASKPFARIYLDVADRLFEHRVSGAAWRLLVEIDRLILTQRSRNPVQLYSRRLRRLGLADETRRRALRQLTKAGLIEIQHNDKGLSPWVRHLGYPTRR
jgi:hypothetical protein